MAYTPPLPGSVNFAFGGTAYSPPLPGAVHFVFESGETMPLPVAYTATFFAEEEDQEKAMYIAHVYMINPLTRETEVLRVTSGHSFTYGEHCYMPLLLKAPSYSENLFSRGTTYGQSSAGIGTLELDNLEGDLNFIKVYGIAGQEVEVFYLEQGDTPSEENLVIRATATDVERGDTVTINLSNRLQELDVPCSPATFEGTNNGNTGLEGTADGIKGSTKPMVYGKVFNMPATLLNGPLSVYGCNYDKDGARKALRCIFSVRDKGGEILNTGTNYDDAATLSVAVVAPGFYSTCLAEGLFKLGTPGKGDVTADVMESTGASASAPYVVRRMLEELKGYVAGMDFSVADLEKLFLFNAAPVGIYISSDVSVFSAVNDILNSVGAWVSPDSTGVFRFGTIEDPSGKVPSAYITPDHYLNGSLKELGTNDEGKNIPAYKVVFQHTRNWKPLVAGSLLESLPESVKSELSTEFRSETAENPDTKLVHSTAPVLTFDTLWAGPRTALLRDGDCTSNAGANWTGTQVSGSGGSVVLNGVMTIVPGTGIYRVRQVLPQPLEIRAGESYSLSFTLVSGTVLASVINSGNTVGAQTFSVAGRHSVTFYIPETAGATNNFIELTADVATGTVVVDDIEVREVPLGISLPDEAARRLAIHSKVQERFLLEVDFAFGRTIQLGHVVELQAPVQDLDDGKQFLVLGRDLDGDGEKIELDLWRVYT